MAQAELQRKVYENPVPTSNIRFLEGVTCSLVVKDPVPQELTAQELSDASSYLKECAATNELRLFYALSLVSPETAMLSSDMQKLFGDSIRDRQLLTRTLKNLRVKLEKQGLEVKNVNKYGMLGRYCLGRKGEEVSVEEVFLAPDGERLYPVAALSDETGICKDDVLDLLKPLNILYVRIHPSDRRVFFRESGFKQAVAALAKDGRRTQENEEESTATDHMEKIYDEEDFPETQETNNDLTKERWEYLKDHLTLSILSLMQAQSIDNLELKKVKIILQNCLPFQKGTSTMLKQYEENGLLKKLLIKAFVEKIGEIQIITDKNFKTPEERKATELLTCLKSKGRTVFEIVGAVCQYFGEEIPKEYRSGNPDQNVVSLFVER